MQEQYLHLNTTTNFWSPTYRYVINLEKKSVWTLNTYFNPELAKHQNCLKNLQPL